MDKKPKRLHVIVPDEVFDDFRETVQWGLRQHLVAAVLKLIIAAVKEDGMMVVGAILSGEYKLMRVEKDAHKQDYAGRPGSIRGGS